MTVEEAAKALKAMYAEGQLDRSQAAKVHLFGIKYARYLDGMPLKEIAARAAIPVTYATEIRKGISLSKYVDTKPGAV